MKKKLLLFDIDGTLILTGGIAPKLMVESVYKIMGLPVRWTIEDFVGNTDRNIVMTLLNRCGISEALMTEKTEMVMDEYLQTLSEELKKDGVVTVLPGVKNLLEELAGDHRFSLGLLTGNVREGARIKLAVDNLISYFPVGAFGDDALNREDLPPVAIRRAEKYFGHFFDRQDVWIIGDSINDIKCARANGLKSLAVASGHTRDLELRNYKPTALFMDLNDSDKIIKLFYS
ncbi:MAG: HAD family hydrolase [Calditrichaeota bacterium]|nr:HAD hydrolase-like protein [Calditrichota bacterium]RQW07435.1 MAG: HAD family hydrolase [Calditrichota bacterium]